MTARMRTFATQTTHTEHYSCLITNPSPRICAWTCVHMYVHLKHRTIPRKLLITTKPQLTTNRSYKQNFLKEISIQVTIRCHKKFHSILKFRIVCADCSSRKRQLMDKVSREHKRCISNPNIRVYSFFYIQFRLATRFSECNLFVTSRPAMGPTHSPVRWVPGLFSGVKRLKRGVNHPLPSSAKVKERAQLYFCSPSGGLWSVL